MKTKVRSVQRLENTTDTVQVNDCAYLIMQNKNNKMKKKYDILTYSIKDFLSEIIFSAVSELSPHINL